MSGTGIRQISHRFKSQTGLLLFSLITDIFGSLSRSISLKHTPLKGRSYYTVLQSSLMFKGACLSLNINNSNAFLSRYVMLCHAFRNIVYISIPYITFPKTSTNNALFSRIYTIKMQDHKIKLCGQL